MLTQWSYVFLTLTHRYQLLPPCGISLGPISLMPSQFNFNEILFHSNSIPDYDITTSFCICHDSITVVPCAKICNNWIIWIFHQILIVIEKLLVKGAPGDIEMMSAFHSSLSVLQSVSIPVNEINLKNNFPNFSNSTGSFQHESWFFN